LRFGQVFGSQWYASTSYVAIDNADATSKGPAIIADFRADRYAITNVATGSIAAATAAQLASIGAGLFTDVFTYTRASLGSYTDISGVLQSAAIDAPRFTYENSVRQLLLEPASTNVIRNNTMVGAVTGTSGTIPTQWSWSAPTGLTRTVTAMGAVNGIETFRVRYVGTTSNANGFALDLENGTGIAALTADVWNFSMWLTLVAGDFTNITTFKLGFREATNANALVAVTTGSDLRASITATPTRLNSTITLAGGATVATMQPRIVMTAASGVAIDFTLDIGLPQAEKLPQMTSVIKTSTVAVTRSADSCQLTAKTLAVLARTTVGALIQGQKWYNGAAATANSLIGGDTGRIIGTNATPTAFINGFSTNTLTFGSITAPSVATGVCAAWDAGNKTASANGSVIASNAFTQDGTLFRPF
jgi:hypothetical protein